MCEKDDPVEVAKIVSEKYNKKGYNLDFSFQSLENEIDKILEKRALNFWISKSKLEAELTAYIGETLCRVFGAEWKGEYYYYKCRGFNFDTCKIEKNNFEFKPSQFIGYYIYNGKKSAGTFKKYLIAVNFPWLYEGEKIIKRKKNY